MHSPSKSARRGAQFVNLKAWLSIVLRQGWPKWKTSCHSSQDRTPPRKWKWRSSTKFSSMQCPMDVPRNPTYKVGILSWRPKGKPVQWSSAWKSLNRSTKGEHLLKYPLGHKPTVTVTSGNKIEENLPRLPTPRRVTLASARQKIQAIQAMRPPEQKTYSYCMAPDTPQKSVK